MWFPKLTELVEFKARCGAWGSWFVFCFFLVGWLVWPGRLLNRFWLCRSWEWSGNLLLTLVAFNQTAQNVGVPGFVTERLGFNCPVWRVPPGKASQSRHQTETHRNSKASPRAADTFPSSEQSLRWPGLACACFLLPLPPPPRHQLQGLASHSWCEGNGMFPTFSSYPVSFRSGLSVWHSSGSINMIEGIKARFSLLGPQMSPGLPGFSSDSPLTGTFFFPHRFWWWSRSWENGGIWENPGHQACTYSRGMASRCGLWF